MAIELEIAQTLFRSIDSALEGIIGRGTANLMIGVAALLGHSGLSIERWRLSTGGSSDLMG